jgi:hypothetical protein
MQALSKRRSASTHSGVSMTSLRGKRRTTSESVHSTYTAESTEDWDGEEVDDGSDTLREGMERRPRKDEPMSPIVVVCTLRALPL